MSSCSELHLHSVLWVWWLGRRCFHGQRSDLYDCRFSSELWCLCLTGGRYRSCRLSERGMCQSFSGCTVVIFLMLTWYYCSLPFILLYRHGLLMGLFFLKQCVGAEEKLMEELLESIVIKMLPSVWLFLREALDAFALILNLIKKCQRTYKLWCCS